MGTKSSKSVYFGDDSTRYEGIIIDGKLTKGNIIYENGKMLSGTFNNNKLVGDGIMILENKDEYKGIFEDNMLINGEIQYQESNIKSKKGKFKDGKMVEGTIEYRNGDLYEGKFKDNKFIDGKIKFGNKNVYSGKFKNDMLIGYGSITKADNTTINGYFSNRKLNGDTIIKTPNGTTINGIFSSNILQSGTIEIKEPNNKEELSKFNKYDVYALIYKKRKNLFYRIIKTLLRNKIDGNSLLSFSMNDVKDLEMKTYDMSELLLFLNNYKPDNEKYFLISK